jgi:hypothetical protein
MNSPRDIEEDNNEEELSEVVKEVENNVVKGETGDQYVLFNLKKGEIINSLANPMYVNGSIKKDDKQVFKQYSAVSDTVSIALGCSYQNSILKKDTQNMVIFVSKNNILAFTNNINFMQNDKIAKYENGTIFLSAYGNYEEIQMQPGDVVNAGIYLMSTVEPVDKGDGNYTFGSAAKIMIQTKNINNLIKQNPVTPNSTSLPQQPSQAVQTPTMQTQQPVMQGGPQPSVPMAPGVPAVPAIQGMPTGPTGPAGPTGPTGQVQAPQQKEERGFFSKLFGMQGGGGGGNEMNVRSVLRSI